MRPACAAGDTPDGGAAGAEPEGGAPGPPARLGEADALAVDAPAPSSVNVAWSTAAEAVPLENPTETESVVAPPAAAAQPEGSSVDDGKDQVTVPALWS